EEGRERETVKVVDFGIAKLRDPAGGGTLTQKGFQPGTVYYMSPEQCRGDDLDARSDVYSLGALCYELLAGTPPFVGETRTGVISKHLFDPPPPFPAEVPVAPALSAVVMRALAKDPAGRPADAGALGRELQAAEREDQEARASRAEEQRRQAEAEQQRLAQVEAEKQRLAEEAREREAEALRHAAEQQQRREAEAQRERQEEAAATRLKQEEADRRRREAEAEERRQRDSSAPPAIETLSVPHTPATPPDGSRKSAFDETVVPPERNRQGKLMIALIILFVVGAIAVAVALLKQGPPEPSAGGSETASGKQTGVPAAPTTGQQTTSPQTPPSGMVHVPGGEFTMGVNGSDGGDEYERPAHRVTLKPFFIDTYEVTNEEYEKFIRETDNLPPPTWTNKTYPAGTARKPVTNVGWDEARAYAAWAGKRLPTEEEWEFAARGTDGRRYPWGNVWQTGMANAGGATSGIAEVGTYKGTSPFGTFDMAGNVWEWTDSALKAYPGGQLPEKPASNAKVLRGGSYKSNQAQATATYRFGWRASGENSYAETGFRCARDINDSPK
nr:SUMF1/EgtB/PvdO family nonheme iron enzyme [Acidobacteriota bacterium]